MERVGQIKSRFKKLMLPSKMTSLNTFEKLRLINVVVVI